MARPESLVYCVEKTDFIERLISILGSFYFIDSKKKRTSMIEFMADGEVSDKLLNLESYLFKTAIIYLKVVPASNF